MPKTVHVMIVEDERVIALHLRKQLEKLGYDRTSAHSAGYDANTIKINVVGGQQ